jgi:transposase
LQVLGYSRLLWLQFYSRQTMSVLTRSLEPAFTMFGGVPAEMLFDVKLARGSYAFYRRQRSRMSNEPGASSATFFQ